MKNNFQKLISIICIIILLSACDHNDTDGDKNLINNTVNNSNEATLQEKIIDDLLTKDHILNLQLEKGPETVLELDCGKYDRSGKIYCLSQQQRIQGLKEEITWESVQKQGSEYVGNFDCSQIYQRVGQEYCLDFQQSLEELNTLQENQGFSRRGQ